MIIRYYLIKLCKTAAMGVVLVAGLFIVIGPERVLNQVFIPREIPFDFQHTILLSKTNQFLACPPDYCISKPQMISPTFAVSRAILQRRWMNLMAAQPRIEPGEVDARLNQYVFIQRSAQMRFPDSITVRFIALSSDKSTLAIYSRSHYGYSDFGVNEARIRKWLSGLTRK